MPVLGSGHGNPSGIDESGYWAAIDSSRPDALRWLSVNLMTGQTMAELPQVISQDPLRRTLNQYESVNASLYVTEGISSDWLAACDPMRTALIAFRGQPGAEVVFWGGVVLGRDRSSGSNEVQLTLATGDCYLDRRYTGAYTTDPGSTGATKDQNQIVADLVNEFVSSNGGLPITVTTVGGAGTQRYEIYNDYDDKTVYSNLQDLSQLVNPPQFTVDWVWNHTTNLITPVLYVGNRIGTAVPAGLAPAVVFDSASYVSCGYKEDWTSGNGANDLYAVGTGSGLSRAYGTAVATNFDGRPRVQYRWNPTTSIFDPLTLTQHAQRALSIVGNGTNTVTITADINSANKQLGVDWYLGDDIGYVIDGPAFPDQPTGYGQCIGYQVTDQTIAPTLYAAAII